MKVYLINTEINEVIRTFKDVISWGVNFVEYSVGNFRHKIYCEPNEYFTNELIEEEQ